MQSEPAKRVFVIDDDPEVVDLLQMVLREEGYAVEGFTAAQAALAAVNDKPPLLAFVDLTMPDMDGTQLCRSLKDNPGTSGVKVVFLSGQPFLDREAESAGADAYLQKPFDLDELGPLTRRVIAGHREIGVGS